MPKNKIEKEVINGIVIAIWLICGFIHVPFFMKWVHNEYKHNSCVSIVMAGSLIPFGPIAMVVSFALWADTDKRDEGGTLIPHSSWTEKHLGWKQ